MTNTTEFKIDTDVTVKLVKINVRKWEVQDETCAVLFTGKTRKMAFGYIDRLVSASKTLAARNKAKATPVKPSKKSAATGGKSAKAESKPAKAKSKPKAVKTVKTDRNLFKFTYGKKIDADTIQEYAGEVWGGLFKLENVHFEKEHYWRGDVVRKDGKRADNIRMDYFCSYCKVPAVLQSDEVITAQKKAIAAAAAAAE